METIKYRDDDEGQVLQWGEQESDHIDEGDDKISFTFNVAPDGIESIENQPGDLINEIEAQVAWFNKFREFIGSLVSSGLDMELSTDFYWGEGDLLVRVEIVKEDLDKIMNQGA